MVFTLRWPSKAPTKGRPMPAPTPIDGMGVTQRVQGDAVESGMLDDLPPGAVKIGARRIRADRRR